MELQFINLKMYAEGGEPPALERFVPVFHGWIQQRKIDDVLIDVADYAHVPAGPGILLIAHTADYGVEYGPEERFGVVYSARKVRPGSNRERLCDAMLKLQQAARLLEQDPRLRGDWRFTPQRLRLTFNRRKLVPNAPSTLAAVRDEIQAAVQASFGAHDYEISHDAPDARETFAVLIRSKDVVEPAVAR